jgi:CRP-like cAMP-binding protein
MWMPKHGMMTVSATIQATEDCLGIAIRKPEHIVELRDAYMRSQEFKMGFLRSTSHYKHCSEDSLVGIARSLRRRTYSAGTTLVRQGELDNKVYFCVAGKLQITQHAQAAAASEAAVDNAMAVLGARSCFGDWAVLGAAAAPSPDSLEQGVVNTQPERMATVQCLTECDLLEMDGYNFLRTVEPRVQEALRHKRQLVESGELSMAAATELVDDHLRRTGAMSASTGTCNSSRRGAGLYDIIRKPRKGSGAAAVVPGGTDTDSAKRQAMPPLHVQPLHAGGKMLLSDTAAQFFSRKQHHPPPSLNPSPPVTPPKAQGWQSGGRRKQNRRFITGCGSSCTEGLPRQRSQSEPNIAPVADEGLHPPIRRGPGGRCVLERAIVSR